jgi:tRNA pseudouridine32 synthase/23S rRNA pseudouridine746 synthase
MQASGHPILGDAFYADGEALAAASRLQLHATELSFTHPGTGKPCDFVSAPAF